MSSVLKHRAILSLCLAFLASPGLLVSSAPAESRKVTELRSELKQYKALDAKIKRHSAKLLGQDKIKLKSSLPTGLEDSDGDGVPDIIEHHVDGTDSCDNNSREGGSEIEAKGAITAVSGLTFTVDGKSFVVSDATVYRDGLVSDLIIGACVEVKGTTAAGTDSNPALRVKFEDSCS